MLNEGATLYLGAFVDELVRSGLNHIVVSPGSRSTPIAVLAAEHPKLKVWMQIDERSAAFFALGLAKSSGQAVALLCTSGTAAANYYPAITEANLSRIPLVVLTADRPHELRDVGAPQTIDQIGLYGNHAKWFMEMPIPEQHPTMLRHARVMASRAIITALNAPKGVVHLNFPLREPLLPDLEHDQLFSGGRGNSSYASAYKQHNGLSEDGIARLGDKLQSVKRGLIICGPQETRDAIPFMTKLAKQLHWPIIADPLSYMRSGNHDQTHVVDSYDSLLRIEHVVTEMEPELFLRFGAMPVSKPLLLYINKYPDASHIIVDDAGWRDPTLLVSDYVLADAELLCEQLLAYFEKGKEKGSAEHVDLYHKVTIGDTPKNIDEDSAATLKNADINLDSAHWLKRWLQLDKIAAKVLTDAANASYGDELFEGAIVTELQQLMKDRSVLFVSNSMPIRDVDSFWRKDTKNIDIFANRGANGIDGVVSTAMGVSAIQDGAVLLIGDLSFYHDLNGLLAAKLHQLHLTIVVVNNDGGGIFSFLPQSGMPRHYELLFGTPIGLDYKLAAQLYGASFERISSWKQFRDAFQAAQQTRGLHIIEVPTNREQNVQLHRCIWPKLERQLQEQIGEE